MQSEHERGLGCVPNRVQQGNTMYGFNLATDHDQVFEVSKRGSVRIDLKFDVALAHMRT